MHNKITAADYVPSAIRTYTPALVGFVLSWLVVHVGLNVDAATSAWLSSVLTAVLTAAYYSLVRALELKYPKLRFLLGHPAQPQVYANPKKIRHQPGGVKVLPPDPEA